MRGTVRDLKNEEKTRHLLAMKNASTHLELVEADLLRSFADAVKGCEFVLHVASPFKTDVKDPQTELVDPAVKGTLSVLSACADCPTVKKVVLTSSVAAIQDSPVAGKVYTEEDWNTESTLTHNSYSFSKTEAEKAAWKFMEEKKPPFKLIVINPAMVIGPSHRVELSESVEVLSMLMNGKYPLCLKLGFAVVDVRDVALSHIEAMEKDEAKGRYICADVTMSLKEMATVLKAALPKHKYPFMVCAPNFLVKFMTRNESQGRKDFLSTNLGKSPTFDNKKICSELGIKFRDVAASLKETGESLEKLGVAKPLS